jgi:Transcriptional regulatory protein, C terminal
MSTAQEFAPGEVAEIRWPLCGPDDANVFDEVRPLMLLVSQAAEPPEIDDPLVDWIRLPASADDLSARCRALVRRAAAQRCDIHLDPFGRLHHAGRWILVQSPIERRLLAHLLPRRGDVVGYGELIEVGWNGEPATANALRVHVARLNRRISAFGLSLCGVREVGYALEVITSR